jgi:hypothetical protein
VKPIGLITRLIGAVTKPGDLVVDPAAGSFVVMQAAHKLGRDFVGCDIAYQAKATPRLPRARGAELTARLYYFAALPSGGGAPFFMCQWLRRHGSG